MVSLPGARTARRVSSSGRATPVVLLGDPGEGAQSGDRLSAAHSAGSIFGTLWRELADVLGTAAAASLVRRAAKRVVPRWPELAALSITRENLEYRYSVPAAWNDPSQKPTQALRELTRELWALLVELTGTVVVNRLAKIPELRDLSIDPERLDPERKEQS